MFFQVILIGRERAHARPDCVHGLFIVIMVITAHSLAQPVHNARGCLALAGSTRASVASAQGLLVAADPITIAGDLWTIHQYRIMHLITSCVCITGRSRLDGPLSSWHVITRARHNKSRRQCFLTQIQSVMPLIRPLIRARIMCSPTNDPLPTVSRVPRPL